MRQVKVVQAVARATLAAALGAGAGTLSGGAAFADPAIPTRDRDRQLADIETPPAEWNAAARAARNWSVLHPNLVVLDNSRAIKCLFTVIRDETVHHLEFQLAADRLMRILAEEGLANLPTVRDKVVKTPCGMYDGLELPPMGDIAAVSIVRAGDTLLEALRRIAPGVAVGKILIQRDESTLSKTPRLFYVKLPQDIKRRFVVLVDPMLATGQSAGMALGELVQRGVPQENIMFLNVVSCPEGLTYLRKHYPRVKIVTAAVDDRLDDSMYIVPGLGDFGDRHCGTDGSP